MRRLIGKYSSKLVDQGLAAEDDIYFLGLDAELVSNRNPDETAEELARVFDLMNINSLLFAAPAEPYRSILRFLVTEGTDRLTPTDCETRTFFHDIPVIGEFTAAAIREALSRRKAAVISSGEIVSCGTVSPEQAFVGFSSVCFSTFVKFFTDVLFHLEDWKMKKLAFDAELVQAYRDIAALIPPGIEQDSTVIGRHESVHDNIVTTGRLLVTGRLTDSYFGNISYISGNSICISQTGSSMDELDACIDEVPLDGSSSAGITSSSELSAHIGIYRKTGKRAIIHGHPKFTVILSMSCRQEGCDLSTCYTSCTTARNLFGIPVVSGEIGTGARGIAKTVPEAMSGDAAVVVYGHGIFAAGDDSFRQPFEFIRSFERMCRESYCRKVDDLITGHGRGIS